MDFGHDESRTRAEEEEENGDRISNLPDELIHLILSFIDLKLSVQTCVLSSRWNLIWTTLPYLNFSTSRFPTRPKFAKFVTQFLSRRNNQTQVSAVNLSFCGSISQVFVKKIADYATSHNVKRFNLSANRPKTRRELPASIFNCQTLEHLRLKTFIYDRIFHFPHSNWDLPALTTLNLEQILLHEGNPNNPNTGGFVDFFSKCVNLKNLTLNDCTTGRDGSEVLKIVGNQLVNLTIYFCSSGGKCVISAPNLFSLKIVSFSTPEVVISAPKLSYFYYESSRRQLLSTDCLHCLVNVNLRISGIDDVEVLKRDAPPLIDMLQVFRCAKFLTVCSDIINCLSAAPELLEHQPSPFSSLKCLTIIRVPRRRKSTNPTLPNYVRSYLLDNSPSATIIMEPPEEPPKKRKSKKQMLEEACTKKVERYRAEIEKLLSEMKVKVEGRVKTEVEADVELCVAKIEKSFGERKLEGEAMSLVNSFMANEIRVRSDKQLESMRAHVEAWLTSKTAEIRAQMTNVESRKKSKSSNIGKQPDSSSTGLAPASQSSPAGHNPTALRL